MLLPAVARTKALGLVGLTFVCGEALMGSLQARPVQRPAACYQI